TSGTSCDREGFPLEADMHNSVLKPMCPWVFQLGSEVTRSACRAPQATPAHSTPKTAGSKLRKSTIMAVSSQLELLALLQGALDALAQDAHLADDLILQLRLAPFQAHQLVGEVQGNHDCDAVVT